jgi:hypothetical protein
MTTEHENLKTKLHDRMLNGKPFSRNDLLADLRDHDRELFTYAVSCSRLDQTIVKLRKAGKITGERKGRTFIWRATNGT